MSLTKSDLTAIKKLFDTLERKVDDLHDKLDETTEMADTNRIEIAKVKRKLGLT